MAKILDVEDRSVFVDDQGTHLKLDISLFDFEPRVGNNIVIFRDENGKTAKVMLGEQDFVEGKGVKSRTFRKIIAFYSIAFGVLSLIGQVQMTINPGSLLFALVVLALGVCLVTIRSESVLHGFSIGTFILYCLGLLSSLYLFSIAGESIYYGEVLLLLLFVFAVFAIPFTFGIFYLVKYYKEKKLYDNRTTYFKK